METWYAGLELGGTKTIAVLGARGKIAERAEIATTTPDETLARAIGFIEGWRRQRLICAIGVGSFGPIRVDRGAADFGTMLDTPKPGWSGVQIARRIGDALGLPLALDTDVNAAALAEVAQGAAQGCGTAVYITIGTGLGGGVIINGRPAHGMLHPEIGHVRLRRAPGDGFAGACPFHGDCAEGLLSGPALAARLGRHPSVVAADDPVWTYAALDLAELLSMLMLALSPERIVIGGGVAQGQPHLLQMATARMPALIGGYLADVTPERLAQIVVPPLLGNDAGPVGSLLLAERN